MEYEYLNSLLEWFRDEASPEQQHRSFVSAGIVDSDGNLTKPYGGDAEPEDHPLTSIRQKGDTVGIRAVVNIDHTITCDKTECSRRTTFANEIEFEVENEQNWTDQASVERIIEFVRSELEEQGWAFKESYSRTQIYCPECTGTD